MGKHPFLTFIVFLALLSLASAAASCGGLSAEGEKEKPKSSSRKLFVFGDSYADTGNIAKVFSPAWKPPYGLTFPKKPFGRFSDGLVLPDFIASYLGIRSPIPYKYRKFGKKLFPYGMNFAVGGSGVFNTGYFQRNLSLQIDNFSDQLEEGVFPGPDLRRSTALVSVNGNDYLNLKDSGGGWEELISYIPKVIEQLAIDLKKIRDLGVAKVAVTNLHPIGCTPSLSSFFSYSKCNETVNLAVVHHNELLSKAVTELNSGDSGGGEPYVILDLFGAFESVLTREMNETFEALRPCCEASEGDRCGTTDEKGVPKYWVCQDPGSRFYWDSVHPTQAGWADVVSSLGSSLRILLP